MFDRVIKRGRRKPLYTVGEGTHEAALGRAELERMLPHRDPFLLLDRIDAVDLEVGAVRGRRAIDPNDPVFAGHFPGDPVYPGVLVLEMIGQLGICLQHLLHVGKPEIGPDEVPRGVRLLKVHHALFQGGVAPGANVTLLATAIEDGDYTSICAGQALVDDEIKALAIFEVFLLEG